MKTIKDFENDVCVFNKNGEYRTVKEIASNKNYYDVLTTFDTNLEINLFTFNEATVLDLVDYLESINCSFLRPDYIPNISETLAEIDFSSNPVAKKVYEDALKLNGSCNEKYMYDENEKKFRVQIKVSGDNVKTFYDFVEKTREDLIKIANEHQDAIQVTPFQIDSVISGDILYYEDKEFKHTLYFDLNSDSSRQSFVTACILKQTARNQEEFDKLRFEIV